MKVWVVGVVSCEDNSICCICSTKEIAERELFKLRDELIVRWAKQDKFAQESIEKFCEKNNKPIWIDDMYRKMIRALSGNDYKKWDNFPHEEPYLYEQEVLDK